MFRVPYWGTVCQDRDDDSLEKAAPGGEADAPDGVPKDTQAVYHGSGPVSHDGNVRPPVQFVRDEDPEVTYLIFNLD
jgi:hypothetical protein